MKAFAPFSIAVLASVLGWMPCTTIVWPCTAAAADANSSAEVQVTVVRATQAWFAAEIRVTGFLVARTEAVVTLDYPGFKITEVLAGEGDRVTAGQILARMTRPATEATGPGAPAIPAATGTLKAPVAGIITHSTAKVGATPSPAQTEPLYRIAADNEIELGAEVPSIHVPLLAPGQTARVEIENNREFSGTVRVAPAAVDPRTQLGQARVSMEADPRLRLGMFARATIEANRSLGISVPRSAVFYRTEGPSVQIVSNGVIETRRVRVGYHSDTNTEIREGLSEGDLVVANAGSSLRDGDKVKPVFADDTRMGLR